MEMMRNYTWTDAGETMQALRDAEMKQWKGRGGHSIISRHTEPDMCHVPSASNFEFGASITMQQPQVTVPQSQRRAPHANEM